MKPTNHKAKLARLRRDLRNLAAWWRAGGNHAYADAIERLLKETR